MINIFQPCLGKEELDRIGKVFASNWIGKGKEVAQFEQAFAAMNGKDASHFTSTTCCTEGIFLAPQLFRCQGFDVIVPTISFVACGNAVFAADAELKLCDVDPRTLNVRASDIEKAITPHTRMVYVTHYGGIPCEMDEIMALCESRGIIVVEDAACATGAIYVEEAVGTIGDMGVWSFDAMKILVTGDGGMIYLQNPFLIDKAKEYLYLGLPGSTRSGIDSADYNSWWEYEVNRPGRRAIMNDIAGAIGNEQIKKLPDFLDRREKIARIYREGLSSLDWLILCPEPKDYVKEVNYMFWIQTKHRDELARFLLWKGVYTTFRYWPLHRITYFKAKGSFPGADYACTHTLNLPIHQAMSIEDVDKVIESIKDFGRRHV